MCKLKCLIKVIYYILARIYFSMKVMFEWNCFVFIVSFAFLRTLKYFSLFYGKLIKYLCLATEIAFIQIFSKMILKNNVVIFFV